MLLYPVKVFEGELRGDSEGVQTVSTVKTKGLEPLIEGDALGFVFLVHGGRQLGQVLDTRFGYLLRSQRRQFSESLLAVLSPPQPEAALLFDLPAAGQQQYVLHSRNTPLNYSPTACCCFSPQGLRCSTRTAAYLRYTVHVST